MNNKYFKHFIYTPLCPGWCNIYLITRETEYGYDVRRIGICYFNFSIRVIHEEFNVGKKLIHKIIEKKDGIIF